MVFVFVFNLCLRTLFLSNGTHLFQMAPGLPSPVVTILVSHIYYVNPQYCNFEIND